MGRAVGPLRPHADPAPGDRRRRARGARLAVAPNVAVLMLGRGLAGLFFAAAMPTAMTYVGDTVAESRAPVEARGPDGVRDRRSRGGDDRRRRAGAVLELARGVPRLRRARCRRLRPARPPAGAVGGASDRGIPAPGPRDRARPLGARRRGARARRGRGRVRGADVRRRVAAGPGSGRGARRIRRGRLRPGELALHAAGDARDRAAVLAGADRVRRLAGGRRSAPHRARRTVLTAVLATLALGAGFGFLHSTLQMWATQVHPARGR